MYVCMYSSELIGILYPYSRLFSHLIVWYLFCFCFSDPFSRVVAAVGNHSSFYFESETKGNTGQHMYILYVCSWYIVIILVFPCLCILLFFSFLNAFVL